MDHDIKVRWINALRSGVYKQGKYTLRNIEDRYCCLGVLCDVVRDDSGMYTFEQLADIIEENL